MILFVNIRNLDSSILAYSASCVRDGSTFRPVAGQIIYNSIHLETTKHFFLNSYATLIHEMFHALGFDRSYYTFYKRVDGASASFISGGTYFMIIQELIYHAKEHYQCSTISKIAMEDEGDAGSSGTHFERLHFGNETMVSEDINNPILSSFTLAVFKGSGFYTINMEKAQNFYWGKNKGCGFFEKDLCTKTEYPEICNVKDELGCDENYNFVTKCRSTHFTNQCMISEIKYNCVARYSWETFKDQQDFAKPIASFGKGSRCLNYHMKGKSSATCADITCAADKKSYSIKFDDTDIFECKVSGTNIKYEDYSITCLDPLKFCAIEEKCPQNCNFMGECLVDGSCFCNPFY